MAMFVKRSIFDCDEVDECSTAGKSIPHSFNFLCNSEVRHDEKAAHGGSLTTRG
jgi:hypothetical protein